MSVAPTSFFGIGIDERAGSRSDLRSPDRLTKQPQLDFTMHLYSLALLVFAIPLAVASAVHPAMK
jgi:hypothetical protein